MKQLTPLLLTLLLTACYVVEAPPGEGGLGTVVTPTWQPSPQPTWQPSPSPTWQPSPSPTWQPSPSPSWQPSPSPNLNPCLQQWCGQGTAHDPLQVHSLQQLHDLRFELTNPNRPKPLHVRQMRDINAQSSNFWHSGLGFLPLGQALNGTSQSSALVYDGNHHRISQLRIHAPEHNQVGLFAQLEQAKITNLHLTQVNIQGRDQVGAIAGSCRTANGCQLENTSVSGQVRGRDYVGGLVGGGLSDQVAISKSSSAAELNGQTNVGGLVGSLFSGGIADSHSTSNVQGWDNIGGLVGYSHALIERSYSIGRISLGQNSAGAAGGLVGVINNGGISDSYFRGQVSGPGFTGGLIGYNYQGATAYSYVAGSVSKQSTVSGPIAGSSYDSLSFSLFWDTQVTGHSTSTIGTGLPSARMKERASFSHWDFTRVWNISTVQNQGYPFLR